MENPKKQAIAREKQNESKWQTKHIHRKRMRGKIAKNFRKLSGNFLLAGEKTKRSRSSAAKVKN